MDKPPLKFQIGDRVVIIGETKWPIDEMKNKKGETGTVTDTGYYQPYESNHYQIDNRYYFEEDCLMLEQDANPVEEIINDEVNDILQG